MKEVKRTFSLHVERRKANTSAKTTEQHVHEETGNLSVDNFEKVLDRDGSALEPALRSGDTGQRISCFDSCQLITTLMCN